MIASNATPHILSRNFVNEALIKCSIIFLPFQFLPSALSLALLPISLLVFTNLDRISVSKIKFIMLLFAITSLVANYTIHSFEGNANLLNYIKIIAAVITFFVVTNFSFSNYFKLDGTFFLFILFVVSVLPIILYAYGVGIVFANSLRFTGFTDHPGNVQIFSIALIFLLLMQIENFSNSHKFIALMIIVALLAQLFFAGGRKAVVAFFIGINFIFILKKHFFSLLALYLALFLIILNIEFFLEALGSNFESVRILTLLDRGAFFDSDRPEYFLQSIESFQENIILGRGYGDFEYLYGEEIHNTPLSLFYSMGFFLGFTLIISLIFMSDFFLKLNLDGLCVLVPLLIIALFANFIRNELFWISIMLIYAVYSHRRYSS